MIAFLVGPEGQIYQGKLHEAIMVEHFDDFPFVIQEILSKANDIEHIRQAVVELMKMGWVRGVWTGPYLNLETYTDGVIEKALAILPPAMLDVHKLYLDAPNTSPEIMVKEGEDALAAFLEDRNLAFAASITWDQIKVYMDKLDITVSQMYTTMGGPDHDVDSAYMWEWLIQEVEPAEALSFLQYEFGVEIDG